jgi:ABC-type transport system involved in multi-copper enzyme maturation permease subunit
MVGEGVDSYVVCFYLYCSRINSDLYSFSLFLLFRYVLLWLACALLLSKMLMMACSGLAITILTAFFYGIMLVFGSPCCCRHVTRVIMKYDPETLQHISYVKSLSSLERG